MPSDEETICEWMQPKPVRVWSRDSGGREWWSAVWSSETGWQFHPILLTLDALWEVEERLTEEQWRKYESMSVGWWSDGPKIISGFRAAVHATTEQKIAALAQVIRQEGKDAE